MIGFIFYSLLHSIGESIGEKVGLQENNLYIGKQPTVTQITETKAMFLVGDYFRKTEKVKLKVIYMVDSQDDNYYYVGAYEDFPERVHIYKWYKVHKVTGKVTYEKIEY
ncbi:hypothetical protein [Paenibacillus sp. IHBB 10380]|uniref:hypothetical protein n=1 Tax=Paenibacillus sp. IHBB 10380 TaxID=1566358 RepID=UPI0005CF9560|nr:hypothetical protein [Paenibacillus sp. IHBB 10380]AJS58283.1 hypothetical protein UB51_06985 [Paenibacillus sp. IHBB 10380]